MDDSAYDPDEDPEDGPGIPQQYPPPDPERAMDHALEEIARVRVEGGTSLVLNGERFVGLAEIPPEVARMTELRRLSICDNPITDISHLSALTGLTSLEIAGTQVRDLAPISNLVGLTDLMLDYLPVTNLYPIYQMTRLRRLSLTGSAVNHLDALLDMTELESLGVDRAASVHCLWGLRNLVKLQHLDLSWTAVSDLSPLSGLVSLAWLALRDTRVSDLRPLAGLGRLTQLNLSETLVTDLSPLTCLPDAAVIDVWSTPADMLFPSLTRTTDVGEGQLTPRSLRAWADKRRR